MLINKGESIRGGRKKGKVGIVPFAETGKFRGMKERETIDLENNGERARHSGRGRSSPSSVPSLSFSGHHFTANRGRVCAARCSRAPTRSTVKDS